MNHALLSAIAVLPLKAPFRVSRKNATPRAKDRLRSLNVSASTVRAVLALVATLDVSYRRRAEVCQILDTGPETVRNALKWLVHAGLVRDLDGSSCAVNAAAVFDRVNEDCAPRQRLSPTAAEARSSVLKSISETAA